MSIRNTETLPCQSEGILFRKAAIYLRQSSGKDDDSPSIAMQRKHCEEFARKNNLEVIGVFEDANTTGRVYPEGAEELAALDTVYHHWLAIHPMQKSKRPGLGKLLRILPSISHIVVDDLTRLSRPVAGSFLQNYLFQQLTSNHITILCVKGGEVDWSDLGDRLLSDIQSSITDNQICIQSIKSHDALQKLKDSGYYPNAPKMFGIRYCGHKQVEVIPESAACIRFIYQAFLQYRSFSSIVFEVNQRWRHLFEGKCCHDSTIHRILKQPFYCGLMRNSRGDYIIAQQMARQPIISQDTWQKVQEILATRQSYITRQKVHVHPFTGLLRCGHCGARLVSGVDNGKIYYHCHAGTQGLHSVECRKSRLNVNVIRLSSEYTGLFQCIAPLLLLGVVELYAEQRQKKQSACQGKTAEQLNQQRLRLKHLAEIVAATIHLDEDEAAIICQEAAKLLPAPNIKAPALQDDPYSRDMQNLFMGGYKQYLNLGRKPYHPQSLHKKTGKDLPRYYELLLRRSIREIVCREKELLIRTCCGEIVLPRFLKGNLRNFPRYIWRRVYPKAKDYSLENCRIEVTWICGQGRRRHLADFGPLRLFLKPDNSSESSQQVS